MMWSLRAPLGRLSFSGVAAVLLSLSLRSVAADGSQDLGTVLDGIKELSTYKDLLKQYPDILLQLPSFAGITIVAPSNDAFKTYQGWDPKNQSMVTNMLEYHILQGTVSTDAIPEGPTTFASTLLTDPAYANVTGGQKVLINKQPGDVIVFTSGAGSRATLIDGDIAFRGGLIQVVDTLMVPPQRLEPTMRVAYKDLTAFLAALYAADLVPSFADATNVTIFAPRNSAFQLLAGTLSGLTKEALARILKYHIVPGQVLLSPQLANGTNLTTSATDAAGSPIKAHVLRSGNNAYIDRSQLVQPDILIANGVVHMVDGVLNPDAPGVQPDPAIGTQPPVFPQSGATSTGSRVATPFITALPCTSDCPVPTTASANVTEAASTSAAGSTSTSVRTTSSKGGAAAARQTGLVAVAGLLGVGIGMVGVA
ncbi:Fasciclin-domain-containing protein [Coniochaeta ligniaria NRRL 30616]|uniref:Fasciclin-domain-containing protein n=1 Tax=Coniochaeta ligniaria NRRL 30616 TaxID=1408157 RepID=A0A1J7IUV5_9PEZI|nr:Fasciclin-domain-containing protein [Coniochaeta ligniaria NRRL 30616]